MAGSDTPPSRYDSLFETSVRSGRGQVVRGVAVTGMAQVLKTLTSLASVVLMSRLLTPADFGAAALVITLIGFVGLLQDPGLTQATIQRPTMSHGLASALFWTNAGLGLLASLSVLGLAGAGLGMDAPTSALLAGFAAVPFLTGLSAQHAALLHRHMRLGEIAVVETASGLVGLGTGVALAWWLRSPWAFVGAVSAAAALSLAGYAWCCRWIPGKPAFDADYRGCLRFGLGLGGSNILNYIGRNADNVIVGRFLGATALGVYDRAYKLLVLPLQQVNAPLAKVMLPILSSLSGERDRYRGAFSEAATLLMVIIHPVLIVATWASWDVVLILLGPGWEEAGGLFAWFGACALHQVYTSSLAWLLLSQGRGADAARISAVSAVVAVLSFLVGVRWGLAGVAAAYVIADSLVRMPFTWWSVGRSGPVGTRLIVRIAVPHALACSACVAGLVGIAMPHAGNGVPSLVAASAMSVAVYVAVLCAFADKRAVFARNARFIWTRRAGMASALRLPRRGSLRGSARA